MMHDPFGIVRWQCWLIRMKATAMYPALKDMFGALPLFWDHEAAKLHLREKFPEGDAEIIPVSIFRNL